MQNQSRRGAVQTVVIDEVHTRRQRAAMRPMAWAPTAGVDSVQTFL